MSGRSTVERYAQALASNDLEAQRALFHPDYVARYPQSGEVIRGIPNRIAVGENYPGRDAEHDLRGQDADVRGRDDRYVAAPSWPAWALVQIAGSQDEFTLSGTIAYPNGETWHGIALLTLRDGKIWREVDYFAPPFDPPDWRAPYVERE
jgi:hypothetical protein